MSEEKDNNIKINEDDIQMEGVEFEASFIPESMKRMLIDKERLNRKFQQLELPFKHIQKEMGLIGQKFYDQVNQMNEVYKRMAEQIQPMINLISNIKFPILNIDFDKFKIHFYKTAFKENDTIVSRLYEETIFPPIYYIIREDIKESSVINCEEWVLNNKDLKLFYINRIDKWKNKYNDDNIMHMIEEIKFNFEHNNSYSIYTLIVILIEYMLRQNYSEEIKGTGKIYSSIKNILNEKVFKPIDIDKLYIRFIEENLYASTSKAKEFSRHITHGDKIELGNMKSAMNMIFIYDFLQDVMIVNKK
ncbi:hypothetical protein [Clostridium botulinum]|uniref:hypothetical protein n=1 Tax=Clostridium botulinum TaxID=1491 RepID=UPI001E3B5B11|nr:hypothetical protein [Clostridium botulinum]MCD3252524.1 hypothetical protein [Clostridium botulinum C/D]MCD3277812.1 hypothetical protein [Clostridium botulinum C/D]MCD3282056.1 hypothetical protein [Clostridium botulinum C/D]MCD3355739.1 hypothetical protein [Clostridium botulinum C/D]